MGLLTAELRSLLPPLYAQRSNKDPVVMYRFLCSWTGSVWLVTEGSYDEEQFVLFGYVIGLDEKWTYFRLSDLEEARSSEGHSIERDLNFKSGRFSQIVSQYSSAHAQ
jgi:hypothetical protein